MQSPEFDEKALDLLVTIFSKYNHAIYVAPDRMDEFVCIIRKLHAWGLITIQDHLKIDRGLTYDLRVSAKGKQFVLNFDPVLLTRSFIRTRFINYAAYWIQRYIPIKQLPEFLVHEDPFIRKAADEKYTGKCSELVTPNETFFGPHRGAGTVPPLLR